MLGNYEDALGEQLMNAVERFRSANAIREFVRAAGSATVAADKLDAVREWLAWAANWAERLDPRSDLADEARVACAGAGGDV